MTVDEILEKYNLTRETTAAYIDAIVQLNQSDTADEIDVSRQTINRYKTTFREMTAQERLAVIAALAQDQVLATTLDDR